MRTTPISLTKTMNKTIFLATSRNLEGVYYRSYEERVNKLLKDLGYSIEYSLSNIEKCDCIIGLSLGQYLKAIKKSDEKIPGILIGFANPNYLDFTDGKPILRKEKAYTKNEEILVATESEKKFIEASSGLTSVRIFPLYDPVDLKEATYKEELPSIYRAYGFTPDKPLMVCLGKLEEPETIKAIAGAARMLPDCQFLVCGTNPKQKGQAIKAQEDFALVNLRFEDEMRVEFYNSAFANAFGLIVLDPWFTDTFTLFDAFMSKVPVFAPELKLLESEIKSGEDYLPIRTDTLGLYESLKDNIKNIGSIKEKAYKHALDIKNKDETKNLKFLIDMVMAEK